MGTTKRQPVLPREAARLHEMLSKSTLHEALLDLWLEHTGRDVHPDSLGEDDWVEYLDDVRRRSEARRRQG